MSRLGWWMLLGFVVILGGFALLVRNGGGTSGGAGPVAATSATPASTSAAPVQGAAAPLRTAVIAGDLAIPVAGVQPGQLTDSWGDARGNGTRAHHAIDIMAARGTPVLAAAAGTVEKLFESNDGGHTIYIRRADPAWIDYYAHLDSYASDLREGVAVRRGQPIGTVGSSGDANPAAPHLHYEIKRMAAGEGWWKGENINPYPILAGKPSSR